MIKLLIPLIDLENQKIVSGNNSYVELHDKYIKYYHTFCSEYKNDTFDKLGMNADMDITTSCYNEIKHISKEAISVLSLEQKDNDTILLSVITNGIDDILLYFNRYQLALITYNTIVKWKYDTITDTV